MEGSNDIEGGPKTKNTDRHLIGRSNVERGQLTETKKKNCVQPYTTILVNQNSLDASEIYITILEGLANNRVSAFTNTYICIIDLGQFFIIN